MSTQEHKAILGLFVEALNEANWGIFEDLFAADFVYHNPTQPQVHDREELKQLFAGIYATFPPAQWTVMDTVAEGDRVVQCLSFSGVNSESFQGLAPTGRPVSMDAISVSRFVGGRIAEMWALTNTLGVLEQVGAIAPQH